jgi:molybdate transport system ATP-binding protein
MSIRLDIALDRGGFSLRVDTELPGQGFSAISGPSGGGKTTLLRAIAGLEPGVRGRICIGDDCWLDAGRCVPTHQRALGYVFQQAALFPHLDVKGNLGFGRRRRGSSAPPLAFDDVVDLLGIARLLERRIDGLSGGERQRVALGQALLSNPRLLLMDEPMASLDRAARQTLLPYLERLQRALAIPVLYVTHALDEVARLAGHMLLIQAGRVTAGGAVGDLLTRLDLPMAHGREAGAVVPGSVVRHDPRDSLSCVRFSGGELWVPQIDLLAETPVRLRILSRDISLSGPGDSVGSILNRVPVVIADVREAGPGQVIVRLQAGDEMLLTRVSSRARRELGIEPGSRMFALIRSVATLV